MKNIKLAIPLIALIIVYLLGSWFYPYSWASVNKSYSYDQDNVSGKEFLEKYKSAKGYLEKQDRNKVSIAVQDFYYTIDGSFIIDLGKQSITKQELTALKLALEQNRKSFTKLFADRDIDMTEESKHSLLIVIDTIENAEDLLGDIQYRSFDRGNLRRALRNTLVSLAFASELTDDFYHSYAKTK
ncbi:hypothetical protein [Lederbergia panacisoli]|uniref:hypothetical protein n=1 Tax=Lederbergia panacisoli TaxID=1255251 RepID=UPI00214AB3DD|nr:hypothetical protein [Lederbergia panacisoli]MCR2821498.1 hypothetical protein [Lederbergia panacisoli]